MFVISYAGCATGARSFSPAGLEDPVRELRPVEAGNESALQAQGVSAIDVAFHDYASITASRQAYEGSNSRPFHAGIQRPTHNLICFGKHDLRDARKPKIS